MRKFFRERIRAITWIAVLALSLAFWAAFVTLVYSVWHA